MRRRKLASGARPKKSWVARALLTPAIADQGPQTEEHADRGMIVDALEGEADLGALLVHAGDRVLEVRLVDGPVLRHERPHEARADAGRARMALAARRAAAVVGEHLGHAASPPPPDRRAEPEVPVLAALDEARVVPADVRPERAPEERRD